MPYIIVNDFLPESKYALKAPYAMQPTGFLLHNTSNDASAKNEAQYMKNNDSPVGYHVVVDEKEARQVIPFSRNAWHGGNAIPNRNFISLEICYSKSGGKLYDLAEENAIVYIAHVFIQYNWGIDRLHFHREYFNTACPNRIPTTRYKEIRNRVNTAISRIKKGLNPFTGVSESKPNTPPVVKPTEKVEEKGEEEMEIKLGKTSREAIENLAHQMFIAGIFANDQHERVAKMDDTTLYTEVYLVAHARTMVENMEVIEERKEVVDKYRKSKNLPPLK